MVPMWPRVQRFANAYAFAAVDILYTIFWFSAFISVATWTNTGIRHGASKKKVKEGDGNCSTFDFGSESKCKVSQATIGSISIHNLLQYRKTGTLPLHATHPHPSSSSDPNSLEAATKDAFSTHPHDDEIDLHRPHDQDDEYALLHSTNNNNNNHHHHLADDGILHAGRPMSWGDDTSYVGAGRGEYETGYGEGGGGEVGLHGRPLPTTPGFRGDPFGDHADIGYGGGGGGGGGRFGREEDLGYRGGGGVRYD
ncbi:MAG: hypothetical protein M1836_002298 [Candelina mexicana]|nr:MAG: hypothetical protein M1836_002298 [Candelina mexicana]